MDCALPDAFGDPASELVLEGTGADGPGSEVRDELVRIHSSPIFTKVALFFKSTLPETLLKET